MAIGGVALLTGQSGGFTPGMGLAVMAAVLYAAAIITTDAYSHQTGGIYLHSSRGFTRTRTIKPDLAAPGVRLPLPEYQEVTGTSYAAAMTAGAAAIMLSWSAYTPSAPRINFSIF